jgi:hypothetical protein
MRLHSSPRHVELCGNLGIVTTLQKQFDNLLFAWTEPNSLILHPIPPPSCIASAQKLVRGLNLSKSHSTHVAILRRGLSVTVEQHFSTGARTRWDRFWEAKGSSRKAVQTRRSGGFSPLAARKDSPKTGPQLRLRAGDDHSGLPYECLGTSIGESRMAYLAPGMADALPRSIR